MHVKTENARLRDDRDKIRAEATTDHAERLKAADSAASMIDGLKDEIKNLQKDEHSWEQSKKSYQNRAEEIAKTHERELEIVRGELQDHVRELGRARNEARRLEGLGRKLEQEKILMKTNFDGLSSEFEKQHTMNGNLQSRVAALEIDKGSLIIRVNSLTDHINSQENALHSAHQMQNDALAEMTRLKENISSLNVRLHEKDSTISDATQENTHLLNKIARLEAEESSLKGQLGALVSSTTQEKTELSCKIAGLEDQINTLTEQNNTQAHMSSKTTQERDDLRVKVTDLEQKNGDLTGLISKQKAVCGNVVELQRKVATLEEQNHRWTQQAQMQAYNVRSGMDPVKRERALQFRFNEVERNNCLLKERLKQVISELEQVNSVQHNAVDQRSLSENFVSKQEYKEMETKYRVIRQEKLKLMDKFSELQMQLRHGAYATPDASSPESSVSEASPLDEMLGYERRISDANGQRRHHKPGSGSERHKQDGTRISKKSKEVRKPGKNDRLNSLLKRLSASPLGYSAQAQSASPAPSDPQFVSASNNSSPPPTPTTNVDRVISKLKKSWITDPWENVKSEHDLPDYESEEEL